jgi:uncharacterized protein YunC (DUF1805 family)
MPSQKTPSLYPVLVLDSITHPLPDEGTAPVVVNGSHGGKAAAIFAVQKAVKGAIFNDAGVGKDQAGIAGLKILDQYGITGACVDASTAGIGQGHETMQGEVSHVNNLAKAYGVKAGMKASIAAELMASAANTPVKGAALNLPKEQEIIIIECADGTRVISLDSNSMVRPEHKNAIVLTGSHGGLVGGQKAVKHPVLAAFYNDAGIGKNKAGISRLAWLEENGIIGITVSAQSACIGVGLDTYESGIISYLNKQARSLGIKAAMSAKDAVELILKHRKAIPSTF